MKSPRKAIFLCLIIFISTIPFSLAIGDPGWLDGWDYRVKITIDSGDVDAELTDFPILIYISDSSGINGENVSFIFDEVGSNSLKIAVTLSDGQTECYVEVEKWDLGNREAWLWTKIASINYTTDTEFYLYYDNDHVNNTDKVGVVGSLPGEAVWDMYFIAVLHLSESSGIFLDSTSNDNDAIAQGTVNRGNQRIDGGVDLPGTDDYVRIETTGLLDGLSECTIEAITYLDALGADRAIINDWSNEKVNNNLLYYDIAPNNKWRVLFRDSATIAYSGYFGTVSPSGAWYHVGATFKKNNFVYGYENGGRTQLQATGNDPLFSPNIKYWIGVDSVLGRDLDGKVDEVRLSSIDRGESYMKASYETGRDHILDFGDEEFAPLEVPNKLFGAGFNGSTPVVDLYWKTNLTGITLFEVQNSTDKVSWTYLGSNTTAEYHDLQVVNGTQRYYRVRACNFTGAEWDNSTWSDINFEKVYFVMPVGDGACEYHIYNASSITVIAGTLDSGNLASTYHVDGDWYNVSEVVGPPGLDVRFNFTYIGGNITCGCIEIYKSYTGHSNHEIQIQVWNFTSGAWHKIGEALYNETLDWVCVGLGHMPEHYVSGGELWFRFYHPLNGHISHTLGIERIDLRVVYAELCPAIGAAARPEGWVLTIMIAAIGIPLIILGTRRRRR